LASQRDYISANRDLWDEWAELHAASSWYDLDAVREGKCKLRQYEIDEVGEVAGKRLLHLMCQLGTDTVCWARRGASTVGIDFSPRAVEVANDLGQSLDLDAHFVCADVLALPDALPVEAFDIVYTSRGILRWIPDLTRWAKVISQYLAPQGFFYMTEIHPVAKALSDHGGDSGLTLGGPYFARDEPLTLPVKGSYAKPDAEISSTHKHLWPHSMGEVVTSLAEAGLHLEFLHEFSWSDRPYPFLKRVDERTWVFPESATGELPLFFSLKATRQPLGG